MCVTLSTQNWQTLRRGAYLPRGRPPGRGPRGGAHRPRREATRPRHRWARREALHTGDGRGRGRRRPLGRPEVLAHLGAPFVAAAGHGPPPALFLEGVCHVQKRPDGRKQVRKRASDPVLLVTVCSVGVVRFHPTWRPSRAVAWGTRSSAGRAFGATTVNLYSRQWSRLQGVRTGIVDDEPVVCRGRVTRPLSCGRRCRTACGPISHWSPAMVASTSPRFTTWRTFRRRCRWSTMAPSSPHPLGMASCVTAPLRVSWVSPKTWGSYIYGNVRFTFDWGSLYRENHYAYWIGFDDAGRQKILRVFL